MKNFFFGLDTKIEFGRGKIEVLPQYINMLNMRKPMIITDRVLFDIGVINPVLEILNKEKIQYEICLDVVPDPKVDGINEISSKLVSKNCDGIIAFGGGSSIDTGKGVAVVATNKGSVAEYLDGNCENKKEITIEPLPIIAIPTTSGTGSEVSVFSVITHNKIKDSITSTKIYPKVAIIDSSFMDKTPKFITANTGLDAFGHALEAIINKGENAFTNVFAYEALKLIFNNLEKAVIDEDIEAKDNMAFAALLAGSAMSHCGASIPHAMGCPLSAHLEVPHGLAVGLLQIPMLKYSRKEIERLIENIVKYIYPNNWSKSKEECFDIFLQKLESIMENIEVTKYIEVKDNKEQIINDMQKDALSHGCFPLNRKDINPQEVIDIYNSIIK